MDYELFYNPIGDSYLLVVGIGAALAALLALGVSGRGMSLRKRLLLVLLRVAVIVLVVLAMLRPTVVYTETKKQSATLAILIDRSRSMIVRDALNDKTRWEALRAAVDDALPALRTLSRDFEVKVKVFTFDADLHAIEWSGGKIILPEQPEGQQTAIGAALEEVLRQMTGKRLLGVILLSDGRQQVLGPRSVFPQTAADHFRQQGDKLHTVLFGRSGRGENPDVAVEALLADPTVFVKNELSVSGQVRVDGYVNREIPVQLLFETSPGKMEVVGEQRIKATADGQILPVKFTYVPDVPPGEYKLTLQVWPPQPGELTVTNNRQSTFVNVLRGGLNVLYVEGSWRVEEKFVRRVLDASRDIHVDYVNWTPESRQERSKPATSFQPGKYDVYILGDVDSSAFFESELKDLAQAVDRGAGLIMLGGFHSFGPGGYFDTPLADVLPVEMDHLERQNFGGAYRTDVHLPGPLRMQPTAIGLRHFALTLAPTLPESAAVWSKLPPLEGANHFIKVKHSRGAVTLATADGDENKPLLVSYNYGNGRVVAFAGDSTWHWPMEGFAAAHKRFWRQMVLWLAKKDQMSQGNVWIKIDKRQVPPGEKAEFTAGAQSDSGEPVRGAAMSAEVVLPDGKRIPVPLVGQGEQMAGSFRDTQAAGDYAIEVTAKQNDQPLGTARARFIVLPQDLELDDAAADPGTMESLAGTTGGRAIAPEQLPRLLEQLGHETQQLDVSQRTKKTLWDKWSFFLTLVGLLSVEWYLRKRWGLV